MLRVPILSVVLILAVTAGGALGQQKVDGANEERRQRTIKFEGRTWAAGLARKAMVEQYRGKTSLHVVGGEQAYVYLPGVEFQDGVIEVDIAGAIFSGIGFRGRDNGTKAEKVYFRPQNAGTRKHEKTVQYAAMGRRDGTWSYLRKNFPGKYESGADIKKNAWFHAKLIIKGSEVKVYVNDGKEPVLVVTDMRYGESKGTVGVWGWNSYFANFRYKASDTPGESAPAAAKAGPDGAFRRPRVLYTQAHGEVRGTRRLAKLMGNIGIDFIPLPKPITPGVLRKAEALYILMPRRPFTAGEKAAIVAFIKRGGSLLLVADQQMRMRLERTGVNDLIVPFGLKLTEDTPYLHNVGAIARKGEINKEDREVPYSGGRAVTGGTPFSFILDARGDATDLAHGAFIKTAAGSRIIVLGDAMASLFMGTANGKRLTGSKPGDTTYWGKDSAIFNREVLEWLTGVAPQTADDAATPSRRSGKAASPAFITTPSVSPNPNRQVPLAALVRFGADRPVESILSVSDGKHSWMLRYDSTRDPKSGLPVVGMRPGRRHTIGVVIRDPKTGRTARAKPLAFTTPPLPEDATEFPVIVVNHAQPDQMEPGITLLSVRKAQKGYGLLLAVDAAGDVVWYYRTDARISDFERLRNGNLVYITHDFRAIEIDLLGNTVSAWYAAKRPQGKADGTPVDTLTFHHEIDEMPSGNLLVLGSEMREIKDYWTSERDPKAPRKTQKVMGDEIIEFQRDGKVVWRWNAFDHLDPYRIGFNALGNYWPARGFPKTVGWSHGNGLAYDEQDDSLLVSLRLQDAILKVDRATGNVVWILGDASDWPEALSKRVLRPVGKIVLPWHQHAPSVAADGTVMIFNNVNVNRRPFRPPSNPPQRYSRAVQYKINAREGTVQQVWASEGPGPGALLSGAMGDADLLPKTGNVLVCYGMSRPARVGQSPGSARSLRGVAVREYTKGRQANKVWELALRSKRRPNAIRWIAFGSERIPSLQR